MALLVELYYSGAWHDITADVLVEDGITITRGRGPGLDRVTPSSCTLNILNTNSKYSPRNPQSELYGKVGRNTPIRISENSVYRFHGEVERWPQSWTTDGVRVWAPITAYGILRRLGGSGTQAPANSALSRRVLIGDPRAYWPLTDGPRSAQGRALTADTVSATWETFEGASVLPVPKPGAWGTSELAPWLEPALRLGPDEVVRGMVMPGDPSTALAADIFVNVVDRTGDFPNLYFEFVDVVTKDSGPRGVYAATAWNGGAPTMEIAGGTSLGYQVLDTASAADALKPWAPGPHHWRIFITQSGADVDVEFWLDGELLMSGTHTSATLDQNGRLFFWATHKETAVGHAVIWAFFIAAESEMTSAMRGWAGETPVERLDRLCLEEGITFSAVGSSAQLLGPQRTLPFLDLIDDTAAVDGGILAEARDTFGLVLHTQNSLYSKDVDVTVDYAAGGEVAPPLGYSEDTDHIANDVTVSRIGGQSTTLVQTFGPLNIQEPVDDPQGVGWYPRRYELNLYGDDQTVQQAAWKRHLGTWDDARYPSIVLDVAAMQADGKTTLAADAVALDVGGRIQVDNPPAWTGPGPVDQIVQGYEEFIGDPLAEGGYVRTITANTTSAGPYNVGKLDTVRIDVAGSTISEDLTTTETDVSVANTGAGWSSTAVPYDVLIGGERMTVTAVSGSGSSQTLTVTRSANGVVKTHSTGAEVHTYQPFRLARGE